ncbi:YT521-B-like domain-containing protein [Trichoderma chlorosporum]
MGEAPASSGSDTGTVEPVVPEATAKGHVMPQNQDHERVTPGPENHPGLPSNPANSQYILAPQLGSTPTSTFINRQNPYNMTPLANALPLDNYHHGQYQRGVQPRYNAGLSPPVAQHMPPIPQYTGPSQMPMMPQGYYVPQAQHISSYYGGGHLPVNQVGTAMLQRQNMAYYSAPLAMGHPATQYYYQQTAPYPLQYSSPQPAVAPSQHPRVEVGQQASTGALVHNQPLDSLPSPFSAEKPSHGISARLSPSAFQPVHITAKITTVNPDEHRSSVRGSSRKPRQTGNAVWIGNLPPQTDLMSLVHHVSKETTGLESLFLIAKSNCAFANFKDEASCITAQLKLHESRFQSVRLVSRLRRNEIEGSAGQSPPTGPASGSGSSSLSINSVKSKATTVEADDPNSTATADRTETSMATLPEGPAKYHDRFFILKSLTVDDLELSVQTGIWATQSHNEETLNGAFRQCTNVYLIFSANKSGEYFGYARMASEFSPSLDSTVKFAPVPRSTNELDLPKEVITDATEYVPRGRILHDPGRGTIFWEIYQDNPEKTLDDEANILDGKNGITVEEEDEKAWGKPFRVEWLSTSRLPFHRIRGLRNPWNSNREVKIARDGTEIEPSVGQRLIGLFNTGQGSGQSIAARPLAGTMSRYQQMGAYSQ